MPKRRARSSAFSWTHRTCSASSTSSEWFVWLFSHRTAEAYVMQCSGLVGWEMRVQRGVCMADGGAKRLERQWKQGVC